MHRLRQLYFPEFIVVEKEIGQIILVTLRAHHTPSLLSCNDTVNISLELSTDCCLSLVLSDRLISSVKENSNGTDSTE
jgi:hypothetical protein